MNWEWTQLNWEHVWGQMWVVSCVHCSQWINSWKVRRVGRCSGSFSSSVDPSAWTLSSSASSVHYLEWEDTRCCSTAIRTNIIFIFMDMYGNVHMSQPSQMSCAFLLLAARLMLKEMSSGSAPSSPQSNNIFITCQLSECIHNQHYAIIRIKYALNPNSKLMSSKSKHPRHKIKLW